MAIFSIDRWLRNASIAAKLTAVVGTFVAASLIVLLVFGLAFRIASGIRAYIGGEGLWSKAQKDAVYYITSYLHSRDMQDYQNFQAAITRPLGDHIARLELQKPAYDSRVVTRGFIQGGIAAADVPDMIFLYRNFHEVSYLARAIGYWTQGDGYIVQLQAVSAALHDEVMRGTLTPGRVQAYAARIKTINAGVTPLEQQFSQTLSEGARAMHALLFKLVLLITALVMGVGIWVARLAASELRLRVAALHQGALRVAAGDLGHRMAVGSEDDFGALAKAFNDMISRRQKAESELKTANDFNDIVMRNATDAIYALDKQGCFTLANSRTCEITGYPEAELMGSPYARLIAPEYLPDINARFAALLAGKGPILNYEAPVSRKDGSSRIVVFSSVALAKDGLIFGAVGAAEDITERKLAEAELQARAEELSRSNRELEQFAHVASHDLQEPLRTISGFSDLLVRRYSNKLDDEAQEYLKFVSDGAKRMKSLIEDLLAYAQVTPEAHVLTACDVNTALLTAMASLRGAIEASGAQIRYEPLPTLPADPRQMAQLFQNLIGNAIKFRGMQPPRILIDCTRQRDQWEFTVSDNGIGIAPGSAERIFGLFQRLHTLDKYPGNGIGLTICKKIVDLHHGRIWAQPGNPGAVFHFTLKA